MVPIFLYHSLDSSGSVVSTSPQTFRRQMQYLRDSSFRVVSLREITDCLHDDRELPAKAVAITFDDGYRNLYEEAYPMLRDCGFPATVFLISAYSERDNQWPGQSKDIPVLDLLRWHEIGEMARHGIDLGAHTVHHPNLSRVSWEHGKDEIVESKREIERRTGTQVSFFAWPYGVENRSLLPAVEEHFVGALSTQMRLVSSADSLYSVPRIDAYYFADNERFFQLGTPAFEKYVRRRARLRGWRQRFVGDPGK